MPHLVGPFLSFGISLVLGVAVSLVSYARLLRQLREELPAEWEALGRPTLFQGSPTKSLALQQFVYSGSRSARIPEEVARRCRFLAWFTPVFVVVLLGQIVWLVARGLASA